jgi:hypothetical protein
MSATPSVTSADHTALVRLYNKTERKFSHDFTNDNGKKQRYELPAGTFGKVPPAVADLWLGMFPGQVVRDDEAHASINGMRAELEAAQKKIAELEKAKAEAPALKPRKTKATSTEVV